MHFGEGGGCGSEPRTSRGQQLGVRVSRSLLAVHEDGVIGWRLSVLLRSGSSGIKSWYSSTAHDLANPSTCWPERRELERTQFLASLKESVAGRNWGPWTWALDVASFSLTFESLEELVNGPPHGN